MPTRIAAVPKQYSIGATARVNAPPERVYGIIADYRVGHPAILPKQFTSLVVEQGGTGAGRVIRCEMRVLGQTQTITTRGVPDGAYITRGR